MEEKQLNIDTEEGTIEESTTEVEQAPQKKMSKGNILAAIAGMLAGENITSRQARQMRESIGVFQGDFTRKKKTIDKRKARRRMQQESRRKNRGLGKGQKKSGRT